MKVLWVFLFLFVSCCTWASEVHEMQSGLVVREYPRHREQSSGEKAYLSIEKFGKPIGEPKLVTSLDPVEWNAERNMVAKGLLEIREDGDYEFRTNSFYDRNELWIDGEVVSPYRDGDDQIVTVPLKKGLVEIQFVGFVESRGAAVLKWRPPGDRELGAIPEALLFNRMNIPVPEPKKEPGKIVLNAMGFTGIPISRKRTSEIEPDSKRRTEEVRVVAKDFVIEVYKNGKRIPDKDRTLLLDRFGASAEKIKVKLNRGDWIVFHVVNNRIRHRGAKYFSAVGIGRHGKFSFVSSPHSEQWSTCDRLVDVERFIEERAFGTESRAVPIADPWDEGMKFSKELFGDHYSGEPIWGAAPSTWIKYSVPE